MSEENRYVTAAGKYAAKAKAPGNGYFGEAGAKASPFIRIPLIVTEDGEQKGREIVWRGYLTPNAFDKTIQTLVKVFGWDGDIEAVTNGKDPFAGKPCNIVCEEEEYEGKTMVKVKWLNAVASPTLDKTKLAAIAKLSGKAKAVAAATDLDDEVWAPEPSEKKSVEDDDDIPF